MTTSQSIHSRKERAANPDTSLILGAAHTLVDFHAEAVGIWAPTKLAMLLGPKNEWKGMLMALIHQQPEESTLESRELKPQTQGQLSPEPGPSEVHARVASNGPPTKPAMHPTPKKEQMGYLVPLMGQQVKVSTLESNELPTRTQVSFWGQLTH